MLYDETIKSDFFDAEAWNNKGNILFKLQRYKESIAAYDPALGIDPGNVKDLYAKEKLSWIPTAFMKVSLPLAIKIDPKNQGVLNGKGESLLLLGKYHEALIAFMRETEINRKDAMEWLIGVLL
jgi:tetratricopeptide (TPR) repeat protein